MIACNITNGHMPHGSNKIYTDSFPNVTNCGEDRFVGEIQDGTMLGYKYFQFSGAKEIGIQYRGTCSGKFVVSVRTALQIADGKHPLYLFFQGSGEAAVKELYLA